MPTLYDLTEQEHDALMVLAEHAGDMDQPEVIEALEVLDQVTEQIELKAEAYCRLINEMQSRGEARKHEAQRMRALSETDINAANALKARMLWFLESSGKKKLEAGNFRVSVARNGGPQPIEVDEDSVPGEYLVKTVVESIDTKKIRELLSSGEQLEFASIVERGTHVRIK